MFNKPVLSARNEALNRPEAKGMPQAVNPLGSKPKSDPTPLGVANGQAQPAAAAAGDTPLGARLIVGPDVKLKGAEILDCDTLVVEGRVEATMDSRVIRIAEQGSFAGKVSIDIAEIQGSFDGELTARSQLIIHATGRVHGKIRYGKLVIDEGGELCGDINALSAEKAAPAGKAFVFPAPTGSDA